MRQKLLIIWLCAVLAPAISWAQALMVRGVVRDGASGDGLPGVTVLVKGTSTGTSSQGDGSYSITVPSPDAVLSFSFVGYQSWETPVNGKTTIDGNLKVETKSLEEVVVVGYGSVAKSDLTGSVGTLKGSELNKTPASSVDQLLQGKVAGVQVIVPSGEPGAGATIRIRGSSSINGSNSPLLVVDGFPWGDAGNLKQINPDDIASIEVLKDASSAAIYGSRGANGVILVTTKKGKAGKTSLTLSTLNTISTLPTKLDVWSDPVDVAIIDNEARGNAGLPLLYTGQTYLGTYYPSVAELKGTDPSKPKWPTSTYWPDLVYRNPLSQSYTLTANGGNERTKFSISGNYYREEGLNIGNNYNRYNGRLNLDQKLFDNLSAGVNLILTHTQRVGGGLSADRNPVFPVYNPDGTYFRIGPLDFGNPIAYQKEVTNTSKGFDVLGTLYVSWDITKWLNFRSQFSDKFGNAVDDNYQPRNITNTGYLYNGFGTINNYNGNELLSENYFTFNKSVGIHTFNAVAGYTSQSFNSRTSYLEGRGYINDVLANQNLSTAKTQFTSNGLSKSQLNSYIGRFNYSLLDRYLFTFTGRADGSSKFGANNKWAFFPSAAVAWKLQEEAFLKAIPTISEAKLRVSYGLTGNQGINPYQTLDRLGSARYYTGGDFQTGFGPGTFGYDGYNKIWEGVPNPDLKWETTSQLDAGLDLGFLNQRFTASLDVYYKRTRDLLRQTYITPSSGYDRVWVNDGVIENKGIELGLSAEVLRTPTVQWTVGGNVTVNRNKLISMGTDNFVWNGASIEMLRAPLNAYIVGQPINVFYGYKTNGVIQSAAEGAATGLTGDMAKPGELKYVDLNGDGKVDDNDRTIIGNPNPKFLYSFNTTLRAKGFDLSAQLYGVQGVDVFDFRKFSPSGQLQRWTPDNPTNAYPSVNSNRAYYGSDWFVTDGSFLRVQNVTLGYNFKSNLIKHVETLRIYLSGNNLYTFTKYHKGFDPEVQANGQQYGSYPRPRAFSVGLNIGI